MAIEAIKEAQPASCPGCDGKIESGWRACPHCGAKLGELPGSAGPGGDQYLRRIAREEMAKELLTVRGGEPVEAAVDRRNVIVELLAGDE